MLRRAYPTPPQTDLVELLGAGTVFDVALVTVDGRQRICKRLKPRLLDEPAGQRAIEREVQALGLVRHPALPRLHRAGTDQHGPYILESCVVGVSMARLVQAWRQRSLPVPRKLLRHLLTASFTVLAELHGLSDASGTLGFVHGDLGPDHLLLGPADEVFFIDFGMAQCRHLPIEAGGRERGSMPYVAPELAAGKKTPDPACDVYALAATIAFVALGRPPCRAEQPAAQLVQVVESGLDLAALEQCEQLDEPSRRALLAALCHDPSKRLQRAAQVLELLRY